MCGCLIAAYSKKQLLLAKNHAATMALGWSQLQAKNVFVLQITLLHRGQILGCYLGKDVTKDELKLIDDCIESYKNMIKYHRKQILELERKKLAELKAEDCLECFEFKIHKKIP